MPLENSAFIEPGGADGADGADGAAATVTIGTVTTLAAGQDATAVNSGTASAAIFDLGIPAGADGAPGAPGPTDFGNDFAYLPPRMAAAPNAAPSRATPGSSYTHGISFYVTKSVSCVGVEGYWSVSGTETVRFELWSPAGASLANKSVETSASAKLAATWDSPVTLTPYQLYHITQCVSGSNSVTIYTHGTTGIATFAPPIAAGLGLVIVSLSRYNSTANTFPNAASGSLYPVAPIFASS